jgi:hypothetical protein
MRYCIEKRAPDGWQDVVNPVSGDNQMVCASREEAAVMVFNLMLMQGGTMYDYRIVED